MSETRISSEQGPILTIRCFVYNHEPYLRQCLDGIVMQKTNFPFEAIVHDDASTDGSAAIIREYAEKYPDIIKPIYETENQYSKKVGTLAKIMDAAMHPSSKYLAICEGDDYWTDPNKLQLQVDFLESHPDYVLCTHDYIEYNEFTHEFNELSQWGLPRDSKEGDDYETVEFTLDNYFKAWWVQPLTSVYRRGSYVDEIRSKGYSSTIDDIFYYYVLKHGKGALLKKNMGVYRRHGGGVWTSRSEAEQNRGVANYVFEIYRIEGDRRALYKTRVKTINMLGCLRRSGEKGFLMRELKAYYQKVPLRDFLYFLYRMVRSEVIKKFQRLFKKFIRKG